MATVMLAWELGGGLAHLANMSSLIRGLCARGHRVVAALRELGQARSILAGAEVVYLQAPFRSGRGTPSSQPQRSLAQILHGVGFGSADEVRTLSDAWRNLYTLVAPDLIVFEHSPTALLAARGYPARKFLTGNGFFCPPDSEPLPDLCPWLPPDADRSRRDEEEVLRNANQALAARGLPPLGRLAQLYHEVDDVFLTTFAEFDPYPNRPPTRYRGVWTVDGGQEPTWPDAPGKRIYAYLKPFPALPSLLALLSELGGPTLISTDGINPKLQQRFRSGRMRFEAGRLNLQRIAAECDMAILNGNHGTTVLFLRSGRPVLQLPIYLEQALNAAATVRLGAGARAMTTRPEQIAVRLLGLLRSTSHAEAARRFAAKYAGFDTREEVGRALDRMEELLQCRR